MVFAKADIYRNVPTLFGETLPPPVQIASGGGVTTAQANPAMVWVGFIVILVVIRFLWEKARK